MYFSKYSWDTNDMLRFSYFDHEMTQWLVTITFTNGMNVANAANCGPETHSSRHLV